MAEQSRRIIVEGVDFRQLFQFPKLFRAIPSALHPPKLLIALFMVLLLVAAGNIWDAASAARADRLVQSENGTADAALPAKLHVGPFQTASTFVIVNVEQLAWSTLHLSPNGVRQALTNIVYRMPSTLWADHKLFTIVYGLFALIVLAIGGGAISRMTAAEFAGHERVRAREALRFSMTNWPRFVLAPLLPLAGVIVLAVLILLLGVLSNIPVLDVIAGLLYIIALFLGFLVAFLLIGYVAAVPMIVPAIACENCDAADAQQRAYAYVLSKPLHWLGYALLAAVALALGFLLVSLFAWATLNLTAGIFSAGTGSPAADTAGGYGLFELFLRAEPISPEGALNQTTAWLIGLWETLVLGLVAAFVVSFFFAGSTVLYLLMRRASDGQSIDEIWRPGLVPGSLAQTPSS